VTSVALTAASVTAVTMLAFAVVIILRCPPASYAW
jgi:hypothetical protein